MTPSLKQLLSIIVLGGACAAAVSAEEVSKADLILEELRAIRQSINSLEERVEAIEEQLAAEPATTAPAPAASSAAASSRVPQPAPAVEEDPGLVTKVMDAIAGREEAMNHPWMDAAKWADVDEGMSQEQVIQLLGEPTLTDPSLNKRIDTVFTYRGRRAATGEKVVGKVKFRNDAVVAIEAPSL